MARIEREKRQRAQARNRILLRVGVTVGVLALLGGIAGGIWLATRPAGPGPMNMASDGILFTGSDGEVSAVETGAVPGDGTPVPTDPDAYDAPAKIVTYVDFGCPYCGQFETTNGAQIEELVAQGLATLEVHPVSILDNQFLGSEFPTRAANAMACIAAEQPDSFLDGMAALYANQPAEGTEGLSDTEIREVLDEAGALNDEISACIGERRYEGWVTKATQRVLADESLRDSEGRFGTPRIVVNGEFYNGSLSDPAAFAAFVAQVSEVPEDEGTDPTPAPTAPSTP